MLTWHIFFFLRKTGKRNRAVFFYFLFFFLKTECNIGYKNSRKTSSTNFFFFLLRYQSIKTGIWIGQTTINYKKCHFVSGTSLIIIIFYFFLKKLNFKNKQEKTKMKKKNYKEREKKLKGWPNHPQSHLLCLICFYYLIIIMGEIMLFQK
jgi:hypothetical protein